MASRDHHDEAVDVKGSDAPVPIKMEGSDALVPRQEVEPEEESAPGRRRLAEVPPKHVELTITSPGSDAVRIRNLLRAFGLSDTHSLIQRGTKYLLAEQNKDGSWGDPHEDNIRTRCHTTWTAIDGLRSYTWRRERVSHPAIKSLLSSQKSLLPITRS